MLNYPDDKFAWLRDKEWPQVKTPEIIDFLEKENNYFEEHRNKELENIIFEELKARVQEEDESYPVKDDQYYYYKKISKGQEHPVFYRKTNNQEELLLDCNALAKDTTSFSLGNFQVSHDHSKLAYAYDNDGSERFSIYVKDLHNDQLLPDVITNTIGEIVWNKKGDGFYYLPLEENWRHYKVYFHKLGTPQENDILIYNEQDTMFSVSITESSSKEYLIIQTGTSTSNESHIFKEGEELKLALPRKPDHLYTVDHINDKFYIVTNDKGKNFRLVSTSDFIEDNLHEIIAHNKEEYLEDINLYNNYIAISKKVNGLSQIEYYDINSEKLITNIPFSEEVYEANIAYTNKDDDFLRISYSSLTTPKSILEYSFKEQILYTRKTDIIPSGYDASLYEAKRLWAHSKDGVKIPISIVYKKDIKITDQANPTLLYGYGSYGYAMPVSFRPNIISLLDRGFIYAIAHIRGGDELGYEWYESAKFLNKKRTFEDFITVSEYLINNKYTSPDKLAIMGGSAGGMLMGVVINQRPELYKSVVSLVPFVDVLNTMLDETLPLTPGEFQEWGNPKDKDYYDYIKSYSPYDNLKQQNYPTMLVTAGLTDPRVGYWEPAKWVAKLREIKTDSNTLFLKTEMDSGHKGQSGRYEGLKEVAMIYSFIITTI